MQTVPYYEFVLEFDVLKSKQETLVDWNSLFSRYYIFTITFSGVTGRYTQAYRLQIVSLIVSDVIGRMLKRNFSVSHS